MQTFFIALVSICLSVVAQFCLKAGMSSATVKTALADPLAPKTVLALATNPYLLAGFALYGLGAVVWLSVLARWDVSKAYPLVGLGFALTLLIGWLAGEQVPLQRIGGVLLICAGVWIVGRT